MQPTIAELIFYIITGIIAIIFFIKILFAPSAGEVKITWGQRRDWERRERSGKL